MSSSSVDNTAKDEEISIGDDGSSQHTTSTTAGIHTVTPSLRSMGTQTDSADLSAQSGSVNTGSDVVADNIFGLLIDDRNEMCPPPLTLAPTDANHQWQALVRLVRDQYRSLLASEGYRDRQLSFGTFTIAGLTTTLSFNCTGLNKRIISVCFLATVAEGRGLRTRDPWSVSHQWDLHRPRDESFARHHTNKPRDSLVSILIAVCEAARGTARVCGTTDGTTAWYRKDYGLVNASGFTVAGSYVFYGVIDPSPSEEPEDGYFTASESFSDSADSDDEN
jgi:hypothetical protein